MLAALTTMIGRMDAPPRPHGPDHYRRYWLPDLILWLLLAVLGTVLFWTTNWDLEVAARFFDPAHPRTPWHYAEQQPWDFFYRAAPILIGIVAVGAVAAIIIGSLQPARRLCRLYGLFILLTIALGPGLIVNTVLKDHLGRPRPRNVVEFGGRQAHLPPLMPGERGLGKSFPCGHCSVGFVLAVFYFLLRRKRPRLAFGILGAVVLFGVLLGMGRIAGGAHFASDVLWAGLISFGVGWGLYYFVLNIPGREDAAAAGAPAGVQRPRLVIGASVALLLAILAGVLLATPQRGSIEFDSVPYPEVRHLTLNISNAQMNIRLHPALTWGGFGPQTHSHALSVSGSYRGFGAPGSRIRYKGVSLPNEGYAFHLWPDGYFTDVETKLDIIIPLANLEKLIVNLEQGDLVIQGLQAGDQEKLELDVPNGTVELIEGLLPAGKTP